MVLHLSDNSHANLNGSYLGACVFFACMFGRTPVGLSYTAGLLPDSALILQQAADSIVFGYASQWNLWNDKPDAAFIPSISGDTLFTENLSTAANQWQWSFGDGATSNDFEPVHVYQSPGTYTVALRACNPCFCDSVSHNVTILTTSDNQMTDPGYRIKPIGPDANGVIRFEGFTCDGMLKLYDLAGRLVSSFRVKSGKTTIQNTTRQLYLYVLLNSKSSPVARGKILHVNIP
jgi:PKD repeat protein